MLTVGGGYGSQRMLEVMDWSGLDAVAPKVVVGYSDVTALLEALASRLGWASVMGPMVVRGRVPRSRTRSPRCGVVSPRPSATTVSSSREARTLAGGVAEGLTAGGNLSLLTGSVGTATTWTPPRAIVLVEDEYEDAPRIDIMLTHLRRSGYFANAAAVVAGTFTTSGSRRGGDAGGAGRPAR